MKVSLKLFFIISTSLLVIFSCCFSGGYAQTKRNGLRCVVIDAGHGGKDPGCVYNGIYEKNITLKVALLLGDYIKTNLPDVRVVYTRDTDNFVELNERGKIANKANADLFISIHVNANRSSAPSGSDTYVMGTDKSNANLDVVMLENDVISYEEDFSTNYEGYIPGSTESFIIFSLMQYAYRDQSVNFANVVQNHYSKNTPIVNRGVKQAGFLVLWKTAMPSVLTEIGFLSNEHDRRFLTTEQGQQKTARSLFNAFSEYKSKVDGKTKAIYLEDTYVAPSSSNTTDKEGVSQTVSQQTAQRDVDIDRGNQSVFLTVQVCSSASKLSSQNNIYKWFKGDVTECKVGNLYKYYVGRCTTYSEALTLQTKVRKSIKDAFIVGMNGDKPISQAEARKLIENKK